MLGKKKDKRSALQEKKELVNYIIQISQNLQSNHWYTFAIRPCSIPFKPVFILFSKQKIKRSSEKDLNQINDAGMFEVQGYIPRIIRIAQREWQQFWYNIFRSRHQNKK